MAWIELTGFHTGEKHVLNTDQAVIYIPLKNNGVIVGSKIGITSANGDDFNFDVSETPADIERLLNKSGITIVR